MTPVNVYRDRSEAGHALARWLAVFSGRDDITVLALPRGGVPVAIGVAQMLEAPLDVFMVRKLGLPGNEELAMGAIATGGIKLFDESLIADSGITPQGLANVVARETAELQRREAAYRGHREPLKVTGRHVVLVDDGLATGYTMNVAILALRRLKPAHVTIAVPVGAPETCASIASTVDELICPLQPNPFHAVGLWYDHFPAVTDEEVRNWLQQSIRVPAGGTNEHP
jgi:putative phosphoribosyl transferase